MDQELNDQELQKTAGGSLSDLKPVFRYCPQHGEMLVRKTVNTCPKCGSPLTDEPE